MAGAARSIGERWQIRYEQDILESRDDIVGHYRVAE